MSKTILYCTQRKNNKVLEALIKMNEWLDLGYNIIVTNRIEGSRGKRANILYIDDLIKEDENERYCRNN